MSDDNSKSIGLAEMISCLREELELAKHNADNQKSAIGLEVEKIDIELQVNVERTKEANGKSGIKFWVVNAEAGGKASGKSATTQTFKITLNATEEQADGNMRKLPVRG